MAPSIRGREYLISNIDETCANSLQTKSNLRNGWVLDSNDYLTGTKPTDTTYLKDPAAATGHYDVLSGTPLKDVARELEKYGRGLRNMGGCSGLFWTSFSK